MYRNKVVYARFHIIIFEKRVILNWWVLCEELGESGEYEHTGAISIKIKSGRRVIQITFEDSGENLATGSETGARAPHELERLEN